jgi:hypothetical protein
VKDDSGAFQGTDLNAVAKLTPGAIQLPVLPGRLVENDQVKVVVEADRNQGKHSGQVIDGAGVPGIRIGPLHHESPALAGNLPVNGSVRFHPLNRDTRPRAPADDAQLAPDAGDYQPVVTSVSASRRPPVAIATASIVTRSHEHLTLCLKNATEPVNDHVRLIGSFIRIVQPMTGLATKRFSLSLIGLRAQQVEQLS